MWLIDVAFMTPRNRLVALLEALFDRTDMTHLYVTWLVDVTWLIDMCGMTHSYVTVMTRSYVTWLIYVWHDSWIWHGWLICVAWLIHMWQTWPVRNTWHDSSICDMTRGSDMAGWYVWHDSFICDMTRGCDMTHSYVWHDSFICDMTHWRDTVTTHWYMWHDSFICDMTHSCDMTDWYVWHDSFMCDMTRGRDMSEIGMTHSYMTWLVDVTWLNDMFDMTHSYVTWLNLDIWGAQQLRTGCLSILMFLAPLAEVTP